ncbi:Rha family transcriptional regulator [Crenobacter sp. SG2305]|uniref:Rha family transcriptional regulator n=1 Tax=Crenobacter oryzisoli TaxID=3056844 RepID=UPI0025AB1731|nr:Rha family transcriptional regulator [Crenobacter sp. SG2305]MDN0085420.1 Rha family transcriptional regulator [Crenobacter sp. SG2305]
MTTTLYADALPLVLAKDGPRIDSRIVAEQLDVNHRQVMRHIERNETRMATLGQLVFKRQVGKRKQGGGNPERFALLNEDQAYFVATMEQNTERAVEVKFRLVLAFREARKAQEAKQGQYLPFYHLAHDATHQMALQAAADGSEAPERVFHINVERMINRAFGIEAGQRDTLTPAMRNAISTAYQLVSAAIADTLADGGNHDAAYQEAKRRVTDFARLFGPRPALLSANEQERLSA